MLPFVFAGFCSASSCSYDKINLVNGSAVRSVAGIRMKGELDFLLRQYPWSSYDDPALSPIAEIQDRTSGLPPHASLHPPPHPRPTLPQPPSLSLSLSLSLSISLSESMDNTVNGNRDRQSRYFWVINKLN